MKKAVASVTVTAWDISNVMNASGESQRIEDSMKKKVYISGKIGEEEVLSEETRQKFAQAEAKMRMLGYDVFNPTTSGLGEEAMRRAKANGTTFYKEILLLDLEQEKLCDAIILLPDYTQSPGARVEFDYAQAIGLEIKFADRNHAWCYLSWKYSEMTNHMNTTKARMEYIDANINNVWIP